MGCKITVGDQTMPNKAPAIVSVVLTIILLLLFGILSIFTQMIALNGVSESRGVTAMGISLGCQSVGVIFAGTLAWWLTNLLITKFHWNKVLAVVTAFITGTLLGSLISFLSIIIAIPVAGIR
jgi:hypothetical protein